MSDEFKSKLEKMTAEVIDEMEKKGWLVYWNKKDKSVFRITPEGAKALAELQQQVDPK